MEIIKKDHMDKRKNNVIFTHIKKTAGTSTINALDLTAYDKFTCKSIPKLISKNWNKKPLFISGHRPYGLHRYLISSGVDYTTMLADPLERIISEYFFSQQSKYKNYEHPTWKETNKYSISECLELGVLKSNSLCNFILGKSNNRKLDMHDMKKAVLNLKHNYAVFGIKKEFKKSIELIGGYLEVPYFINNVIHKQTQKETIAPSELKKIKKYFEYDIEFYKHAEDLFYKQF